MVAQKGKLQWYQLPQFGKFHPFRLHKFKECWANSNCFVVWFPKMFLPRDIHVAIVQWKELTLVWLSVPMWLTGGWGGAMKFYSCGADGESCDKTAFRRMFPSPPLSTTQLKYLTSNQIFRGYAPFLLNLLQHKRARFLKKSVVAGSGRQDFLCQLPLWDDRHVRGQQPHHQIHHHHHIQIQPISILIRTA